MFQSQYRKNTSSKRPWIYLSGGLTILCIALLGVLIILPAVSPASGAQTADLLRAVVGPQPVADLESVSFRIKDTIYQYISAHNGGKVQISLNQPILVHQ